MTPLEYFRLFAPELASKADGVVTAWLAVAATRFNSSGMDPDMAAQANALYAAHLITLQAQASSGAATGIVVSEREGDVARTYQAVTGSDPWLALTTYGSQFADLTRGVFGSAILTAIEVD